MFVLVKWAEGITLDKGKFSIVTQSCVRGFDASEWLDGVNEEENQTFVIEWREGKNQLKGGWSVFLAQIIKVAERENTLEKVLRDYIDQPDDATAKKRTPNRIPSTGGRMRRRMTSAHPHPKKEVGDPSKRPQDVGDHEA